LTRVEFERFLAGIAKVSSDQKKAA
jgi:hypothetical protein